MKTCKVILSVAVLMAASTIYSQEVNWKNTDPHTKHFLEVHFGADYCSYYGVSYGYNIMNTFLPVIAGTDFDLSFGSEISDDLKSKTSLQAEIWRNNYFSWSVKPGFIVRRYESDMARLVNLGADFTTCFGYLKPTWGIAATINYDHTLATHIHNKVLKEYYPESRDGWYGTTGGNFKFGTRMNVSVKTLNFFVDLGKTYARNFKDNPTLPFYAEFSVQKQF
jgi:hypothetical protein